MDTSTGNNLNEFLSDIGFPIDKSGLVQESHEFPLDPAIRDAIALLPDKEYASREDLKRELIHLPFDDEEAKKDEEEELGDIADPLIEDAEPVHLKDEEIQESL